VIFALLVRYAAHIGSYITGQPLRPIFKCQARR